MCVCVWGGVSHWQRYDGVTVLIQEAVVVFTVISLWRTSSFWDLKEACKTVNYRWDYYIDSINRKWFLCYLILCQKQTHFLENIYIKHVISLWFLTFSSNNKIYRVGTNIIKQNQNSSFILSSTCETGCKQSSPSSFCAFTEGWQMLHFLIIINLK